VSAAWRGCVIALAVTASACAPGLMKLPSGAGAPAPDARDALVQATNTCRGIRTVSAEVAVSGSVAKQGLRGRMLVGLAAPDAGRIEAVAPFGPPVFILVAKNDDATLLLPRDDRVLEHGTPAEVLQAVAGVPIGTMELRRALTGCPASPDSDSGRSLGSDWRIVADGPDLAYLHRDNSKAAWQIDAILHRPPGAAPWRAEYKDFQNGLPRSVRLVSEAANVKGSDGASADNTRTAFDLRLALSQVDINIPLGDDVFRVEVPRSAKPITLQELRNARPGVREN
jgi:hypothetical protein